MARAQMDIMNLVIATAVMVVISIIGLMWYGSNSFDRSYMTLDTAYIASNLPEIQCSYRGSAITGCIDILKAGKAGNEYYTAFGYSTVSLHYIEAGLEKNITLYELKKDFRRKEIASYPVNAYDANTGRFYEGKILVEAYS
jgi:hypothetical protein